MSNNWPAFRTPLQPFNITQVWAAIPAAILTLILVPLLGYSVTLWNGSPSPTNYINIAGPLLLTSGTLAWVGMFFGVPASFRAQRKGWAGWGIGLLAGLTIGAIVGAIVGLDSETISGVFVMACMFGAIGLLYAGTYWLLFRLFYPKAFCWPNGT